MRKEINKMAENKKMVKEERQMRKEENKKNNEMEKGKMRKETKFESRENNVEKITYSGWKPYTGVTIQYPVVTEKVEIDGQEKWITEFLYFDIDEVYFFQVVHYTNPTEKEIEDINLLMKNKNEIIYHYKKCNRCQKDVDWRQINGNMKRKMKAVEFGVCDDCLTEIEKTHIKYHEKEYKFYKKLLAEGDNIYTMCDAISNVEDGYDVHIYYNGSYIMAVTDRRKKKKGYEYLYTVTPDFIAKVANDFCQNEGKGIRIDNSCASWGIKFEIGEKIIEEIINDIMQTEKYWTYK